jgi:hypothetical protein
MNYGARTSWLPEELHQSLVVACKSPTWKALDNIFKVVYSLAHAPEVAQASLEMDERPSPRPIHPIARACTWTATCRCVPHTRYLRGGHRTVMAAFEEHVPAAPVANDAEALGDVYTSCNRRGKEVLATALACYQAFRNGTPAPL